MAHKFKGFNNAFSNLKANEQKEARALLFAALGIKNRNSFRLYRAGKIEPKISQAEEICKIFEKFGIEDPWN